MQANTSYVLWVTAFNVSFLFLNLALELLSRNQGLNQAGPAIFDALNRNSLAVFLLVSRANVNTRDSNGRLIYLTRQISTPAW